MAEPVYLRVRRLLSASVEDSVDRMERAGGAAVMREAVREVDRAVDDVRSEHEAAIARRLNAARQQRLLRERATALDGKARVALSGAREDLAEAALSRQIDFEAQAERLEKVQADAAEEAGRLEECLTALQERKSLMQEELTAFEQAQRDAALGGEGACAPRRHVERKVERAEQAFERAMSGAGGVGGVSRADAKVAARVAEIDVMQKSAVVAERMAALRAAG